MRFIQTEKNNIPFNITATPTGYEIEALMPGLVKEDINIEYDEAILTVAASRSIDEKEYIFKGFDNIKFKMTLDIPGLDINNWNGSYENGVLKLVLPKLNKTDRLVLQ